FNVSSSGSLTVKSSGAVNLSGVTLTAGTFDASAVTGKVTATTLTSAAQIVKTGSAGDALTYTGAGSITVESGAGNDTVTLDDATYSGNSVSINLGDGTADTLVLDGAGTGTLLIAGSTGKVTLAGIENIRVTTGTVAQIDASQLSGQAYTLQGGDGTTSANVTLGAKVSSSATSLDFTKLVASTDVATKFTGSTLAVDASANTSAITILGMTKVANSITGSAAKGDSLVGGELNDTFTYSNSSLLFADKAMLDTIVGGAGNDDLLTVTAGNIAATDSFANLSSVEKFSGGGASLVFGATAETAGLKTFTVTMAAATTISTGAYTTTATSITANGAFAATITASAAGSTITASGNAAHVITGGAGADSVTVAGTTGSKVSTAGGNDTITGGTGADSINAGDGDDAITGAGGADTLIGGAGS
ncbi:MAG: hypothetical protein EBU85_07885, partial [Actinobacteria bacterium]|nr:hypothetical protein [Actinomycetota bacterium]